MRSQLRGKIDIYYQNVIGTEADEFGNVVKKKYGDIQHTRVMTTTNYGFNSEKAFGKNVDYDRSISIHDRFVDITEYARIWFENDPTTQKHDYEVSRRVKTINCLIVNMRRVNVE